MNSLLVHSYVPFGLEQAHISFGEGARLNGHIDRIETVLPDKKHYKNEIMYIKGQNGGYEGLMPTVDGKPLNSNKGGD